MPCPTLNVLRTSARLEKKSPIDLGIDTNKSAVMSCSLSPHIDSLVPATNNFPLDLVVAALPPPPTVMKTE